MLWVMTSMVFRESPLEIGMTKGENPVHHERLNAYGLSFRVALAGMPAQIAWYIACEAQHLLESDSKQVP